MNYLVPNKYKALCIIDAIKEKTNKNSQKTYDIEFKIIKGKYKGFKCWLNVIQNPESEIEKFHHDKWMKQIGIAIDSYPIDNIHDAIGRTVIIEYGYRHSKNGYLERNFVKKIYSVNDIF